MWVVTVLDLKTKLKIVRRAKVLVSGVGSLSVPKKCDIPGKEKFGGMMFHSAEWDHGFEWEGKDVVVLGECSNCYFLICIPIKRRKRVFSNAVSAHYGE